MGTNVSFATGYASASARHRHGVFNGQDFGANRRGHAVCLARAHGAAPAAALTVQSFAEGYFGAPATLSPARAASLSLAAVNRWLCAQSGYGAVSFTALLLHNGSLGLLHLGAGILLRYRGKRLTPLLREHINSQGPTRAIGVDLEMPLDFAEDTTEPADRYLIISGLEAASYETIFSTLSAHLAVTSAEGCAQAVITALGNLPGTDKAALVLDILSTPTAASAEPLAGQRLRAAPKEGDIWDGFIMGKTLYQGRYTMLKAAYDSIGKREVAVKIPLPAMLQDEVFAAGFMREAWIGATVRGQNVARYLELAPERRSSLYLVMPLYKGETLEARLHRAPVVSLPEGAGIALKLCEAVQDLAAIQVIHRDIKPENIMLLARGEIILLDLGLAYLPGIDLADAVKPGGTIRYMAPELLNGVQANARTEVFALAVTIYRMFAAGKFPFGQSEAVPLAKLRPDLPSWLGRVLARGLATDPAARFSDAGALAAALQHGLVTGADDPPRAVRRVSELAFWRGLAVLLALGCLVLWLRK
jgi:hypothetical protein